MQAIGTDVLYPLGDGGMRLIPTDHSGTFATDDNAGRILRLIVDWGSAGSTDQVSVLVETE